MSEAETEAEILREQLLLYAENYHRFVLDLMPRLDRNCSEKALNEISELTVYYRQAFADLANQGERLATLYYLTSSRLLSTLWRLLGRATDLEDLIHL